MKSACHSFSNIILVFIVEFSVDQLVSLWSVLQMVKLSSLLCSSQDNMTFIKIDIALGFRALRSVPLKMKTWLTQTSDSEAVLVNPLSPDFKNHK